MKSTSARNFTSEYVDSSIGGLAERRARSTTNEAAGDTLPSLGGVDLTMSILGYSLFVITPSQNAEGERTLISGAAPPAMKSRERCHTAQTRKSG